MTRSTGTIRIPVAAVLIALLALVALLAIVGPVSAQEVICQDPVRDQYGVPTGPANCTVVEAAGGSSLPFTGLDVGTLLAIAVALTGAGVALRRFGTSGGEQA